MADGFHLLIFVRFYSKFPHYMNYCVRVPDIQELNYEIMIQYLRKYHKHEEDNVIK